MNKKTFIADGRNYQKGSRWIKIQHDIIRGKNHCLYDYKDNDNSISFFTHNSKKYAISQFIQLSYPIMIEINEEDTAIIGGYDIECSYKPYLLEISNCGEYVRLWEEVSEFQLNLQNLEH